MKLRTALRLGRVSNLPTVITNVLAGCMLSTTQFSWPVFAGLCAAMTLAYVGGMYLNDAFDREYDARFRPERPIPSGEVSAKRVFVLGFGMLGLGVASVVLIAVRGSGGAALTAGSSMLALAGTIVFYDLYHKQNPFSPLVMGACRVLVYLTAGLTVASWPPSGPLGWGCAALLGYLIGLSYAAKQENFGKVENVWPLLFLALPCLSVIWIRDAASAALLVLFTAWMLYSLSWLMRREGRNIPRAIGHFIAGISLLDGALIALVGAPELGVSCVAGFALTVLLQRVVPGT
ncbi:MAG TPA: UbiA family prenyltransferase [Polyangiales bacterium]|nr:UbiA family prenyltransferase [Polyangiales bacterium]